MHVEQQVRLGLRRRALRVWPLGGHKQGPAALRKREQLLPQRHARGLRIDIVDRLQSRKRCAHRPRPRNHPERLADPRQQVDRLLAALPVVSGEARDHRQRPRRLVAPGLPVPLEERQHSRDLLPRIQRRLLLRRQVGAQPVVQRHYPPCPVARRVCHRQHVGVGSQCRRLLWRVELDPHALAGSHCPRNLQHRPVGIDPGKIGRPARLVHVLRNPRPYPVRNTQHARGRTPAHLRGCVAWDHRNPRVRGRLALHGHSREPRRPCRRQRFCLVRLALDHSHEGKPSLFSLLDQRLQRLLLVGVRRQPRSPADRKAVHRRSLQYSQRGRIKPVA